MVAKSSDDACRKDWRRTLVNVTAGGSGDAKGVCCSPGLLVDLPVRQFRIVRSEKRNHPRVSDTMRDIGSWCDWNDARAGERFRRIGPCVTATPSSGGQRLGSPTGAKTSVGTIIRTPAAPPSTRSALAWSDTGELNQPNEVRNGTHLELLHYSAAMNLNSLL